MAAAISRGAERLTQEMHTSVLFWLKALPVPEPLDAEKHWQGVNRIIERHSTQRGIETNEHRELLMARKR